MVPGSDACPCLVLSPDGSSWGDDVVEALLSFLQKKASLLVRHQNFSDRVTCHVKNKVFYLFRPNKEFFDSLHYLSLPFKQDKSSKGPEMALPFWKRAEHRIPTLGLYRRILKTVQQLPVSCVNQPGKRRKPIPGKGTGPPGSSDPLPAIKRSFLFAWIRDRFRYSRHCTSPRITKQYLLEAEEVFDKLQSAKNGDKKIRDELRDMVHGRTGRIKDVLDHVSIMYVVWTRYKTGACLHDDETYLYVCLFS